MIVDLSHSSIQTALDTLAVSDAPVIYSHSSAQAICNSTRNIPDTILRLVVSTIPFIPTSKLGKIICGGEYSFQQERVSSSSCFVSFC